VIRRSTETAVLSERALAGRKRVATAPAAAIGCVWVGAMWFLVVRRELEMARGDWVLAAGPIAAIGVPTLLGIVLIYVIVVAWAAHSSMRAAAIVAIQPDAIVLQAARASHLVAGLISAGLDERFDFVAKDFPHLFTFVANEEGIEAWGGPAREPYEYFWLPWSEVDAIRVSDITEIGRISRGLVVTVHSPDHPPVDLEFVVDGNGLAGVVPMRERDLRVQVDNIAELKAAS